MGRVCLEVEYLPLVEPRPHVVPFDLTPGQVNYDASTGRDTFQISKRRDILPNSGSSNVMLG